MTVEHQAREFVNALTASHYTVVLTGAGVSTDSGIPDFRSPDGLYSKISASTFELDFLLNQPEQYYQIAVEHIHPLADSTPNITHRMLAELFAVFGASLQVQPAAGIGMLARECGARLFIINREPTGMDVLADQVCHADLKDFSNAVMELLAQGSD